MDLNIIKYCAEECDRQGSGELSVYDMCNAWYWAHSHSHFARYLTLDIIQELGKRVEPQDNKKGFRTFPIFVSDGFINIEKSPWERVPELLTLLIASYYEGSLTPSHKEAKTREDQFYFDYENIHPFRDGNGRTGKIIYNYLNGTLDNPILPPNFWGYANL